MWGGEPPPRSGGRRHALTVRRIARAAIELANAEGLDALSMRRVAEHLDVSTMSLYTYVPGKAELIDVMLDSVYLKSPPEPVGATWRERLGAIARHQWDLLRRHPWMLRLASSRPPMGPGVLGKYEQELRAVDGLGLTDVEMDALVTLVNDYVGGAARSAVDAVDAVRTSGMGDEEWWAAVGPRLSATIDAERFPLATRVGTTTGQAYQAVSDPEHAFAFGLARLLDGVDVLVRNRRSDPVAPDSRPDRGGDT